jgi:WD40 repeat protein
VTRELDSDQCGGRMALLLAPRWNRLVWTGSAPLLCAWDLAGANAPHGPQMFRGENGGNLFLAASTNGESVVSGNADFHFRLWDMRTLEQVSYLGGQGPMQAISISDDGRWAAATGKNELQVMDCQGRQMLTGLPDLGTEVTSLRFSHDGARLAVAGADRSIRVFPTGAAKPEQQWAAPDTVKRCSSPTMASGW